MDAAAQILSHADEVRRYTTRSVRYREAIEFVIGQFAQVHPGVHLDDFYSAELVDPVIHVWDVRAKHAIMTGSPGTEVIADELKMIVPKELQDFYSRIHECLLILRYPVRIYSPAVLVYVEKMLRDAERSAGLEVPDEVSVLRLVEIPGFSSCMALRHFKSDGTWRMIDVGDEDTLELQEGNDNNWLPDNCEFMDDWFRRILETDAAPLAPGNPYVFRDPMATRVG